ncbi:MAG: barstar family protein [Clostridiaceae bacterium]|jgi:ribonuclease inhibitor|nr:barstar family protein [Bacillota bacterium]NLN51883.1 barstar family protein [Clostridiaceae bacterium]
MRLIQFDFIDIKDKETLHEYLAEKLDLPDHYGNNLDALWDCLLELSEYTLIEMKNIFSLYGYLGDYSAKFLKTLDDAALANSFLWLKVLE